MSNEPKFYPIDPDDAYPEAVGTLDQIEHHDGALWVHLNGKRSKLVGLQSLSFLIGQLEQIRAQVFGRGIDVPRYLPHWNDQLWREYPDGDWVKVDDHLAAMVALRADPSQAITLLDERAEFERIFGIGEATYFMNGKYRPCGFTQQAKDTTDYANTYWQAWIARASLERAQADAEAPAIPTVGIEWIACDERLPEQVKADYLCLFEDGHQQVSEWLEDNTEGWVFWYGNPTHWMPLPGKPAPARAKQ